jgi:xylulokinase
MDAQSTACFYGLRPEHDGGSLVRAVMEGVVYSLRQCLDLMEGVSGEVQQVVASGGGARHPLWLRLMADIFDRPIYRSTAPEGAALGAALLAGVGCGMYADVPGACAESVRWSRDAVQPELAAVERYAAAYPVFLRLYPAARSIRD